MDKLARDDAVCVYGTPEPAQSLRPVHVGPLSFLWSGAGLRRIAWHGTELVRAIAWPIRDKNWGTYGPDITAEDVNPRIETFAAKVAFTVAEGRLRCVARVEAEAGGRLHVDLTMTPVDGAFATNRAGLTVLHPIAGLTGAPLRVVHADGSFEDTRFPQLISAAQPVRDISGLGYGAAGQSVEITFAGEVFEMEDQRNWTDASYKTYCVPLVHPFTYALTAPVTQTMICTFRGDRTTAEAGTTPGPLTVRVLDRPAPGVGLAVEPEWCGGAGAAAALAKCRPSHLLARVGTPPDPGYLGEIGRLALGLNADVDAEIVVGDGDEITWALTAARHDLTRLGVSPARVFAQREAYFDSHQPGGPWPAGPTPDDMAEAARRAFPEVRIGSGMMTNFTEFNRRPPDPALCDYVSHGTTAIVHAADDMSVSQTLETLPQVFASAEALCGGKAYRLGLMSIGMRSNPYGADVVANPNRIRQIMARDDPRQRGLFAAVFAVGVLAATQDSAVEALCLGAPVGPFGLMQEAPGVPVLAPLFHVFRAASFMAGAPRLAFGTLPGGVAAYGVTQDGARHALFANASAEPCGIDLERAASVAVLDITTCPAAAMDPRWLEVCERRAVSRLDLGPFAVGFATWNDAS